MLFIFFSSIVSVYYSLKIIFVIDFGGKDRKNFGDENMLRKSATLHFRHWNVIQNMVDPCTYFSWLTISIT